MLQVNYKSGDGESFITGIKKKENPTDDWISLSNNDPEFDTLCEDIEDKYNHIIFYHDHDDNTGYGSFIIDNNKNIVEPKYLQE